MIFNLGIESFEFTVDDVTTFDVMLFNLACSMPLFLLLVTFKLLADLVDDGEFRAIVDGFGLTTQLPVDVACCAQRKKTVIIDRVLLGVVNMICLPLL